jgi:hypothetical protein
MLGAGVLFDAEISSVDEPNGYVYYTNDVGEDEVVVGMSLFNITETKTAEISDINTGLNRITVTNAGAVSGWTATQEISVSGPLFWAQVDSIASDVITYTEDRGEDNLAAGQVLANATKKSIAEIDTGGIDLVNDEITVTDSSHIEGWEVSDVIMVGTSLFTATVSSVSSTQLNYSSPIGERIVASDTGWVIYNEDTGGYATVDSWTAASNYLDVTVAGDIVGWTGDTIRIYSPFQVDIRDSDDNVIWPTSDVREGAAPHNRTAIDELTTGTPTELKIRCTVLVASTIGDSTFAQLSNIRAYSTEDAVTPEMLTQYCISILSAAGHDLDSSEDDVEEITRVLEPMVFEFTTPKDAMSWACSFGDGSGNRLAWGVKTDDRRRVYIETQDLTTIDYVVRRTAPVSADIGGSIQESLQQVRGVYTDKLEEQYVTDWQSDEDSYFDSHFRRASVTLENVDNETDADTLVTQLLSEIREPKQSARYSVREGSVFTIGGAPVPIDEIKATGGLIMIEDWRSAESGLSASTDARNSWTIEQLVGVEIDYAAKTASLMPASPKSTFELMMAELQRVKSV